MQEGVTGESDPVPEFREMVSAVSGLEELLGKWGFRVSDGDSSALWDEAALTEMKSASVSRFQGVSKPPEDVMTFLSGLSSSFPANGSVAIGSPFMCCCDSGLS